MSLINVGLENLGTKIKTYSSCLNSLQQPDNILNTIQDSLWATGEGLPQFVIVSLQELEIKIQSICQMGFLLWHDYDTNPKSIELWVAETTDQEFTFWAEFFLQQKKGIQLYQINPLPANFIYLKISITETYGAFETYLNQIYLMAKPSNKKMKVSRKTSTKKIAKNKKELNLQDLESNLQNLIQMQKKITRSKSKKKSKSKDKSAKKPLKQKILNRSSRIKQQNEYFQHRNETLNSQENNKSKSKMSKNFSIYYHEDDIESRENLAQKKPYQMKEKQLKNLVNYDESSSGYKLHDPSFSSQALISGNLLGSPQVPFTSSSSNTRQQYSSSDPNNQSKNSQSISLSKNKPYLIKNYQIKKEQTIVGEEEEELQDQNEQEQDEDEDEEVQEGTNEDKTPYEVEDGLTPRYQPVSEETYSEEEDSDEMDQNIAILALSKHVVRIEDDMEEIQRKVNILDMKVSHSHNKIQQQIYYSMEEKVDKLIQKKLSRKLTQKNLHFLQQNQQNIQQYKKTIQNKHKNHNYKKNLTNQFYRTSNQGEMSESHTKRITKEYPSHIQQNRLKTSKSFTHIVHQDDYEIQKKRKSNKTKNQTYIGELLEKLNRKLKEREVKLYKLREKQKSRKKSHSRKMKNEYSLQTNQKYLKTANRKQYRDKISPQNYRITTADDYYGVY